MPEFSVIMPSYLGHYKGAASDRPVKLVRAINSIIKQSFQNFEIIVVADGCRQTMELLEQHFEDHPKIFGYLIEKQRLWSSGPRNFGISKADGNWITYLDIDDYWELDFLQTIHDNKADFDWVYFDNYQMRSLTNKKIITCEVGKVSSSWRPGTCNIAHRNLLKFIWGDNSYSHDIRFIESLKKESGNYGKIPNPGYVVCHIPKRVDV